MTGSPGQIGEKGNLGNPGMLFVMKKCHCDNNVLNYFFVLHRPTRSTCKLQPN